MKRPLSLLQVCALATFSFFPVLALCPKEKPMKPTAKKTSPAIPTPTLEPAASPARSEVAFVNVGGVVNISQETRSGYTVAELHAILEESRAFLKAHQ